MSSRPIRVLIVNDSPTVRSLLRSALGQEEGLEVCGSVASGNEALAFVAAEDVDVILLDVVMSGMDGYATTRAIMTQKPTPIVLVSGIVDLKSVGVAMEALRAGALATAEMLPAPTDPTFSDRRAALGRLLRAISKVQLPHVPSAAPKLTQRIEVIGIAASIGGPPIVAEILGHLPLEIMPPILLVQHIASGFEAGFAEWLTGVSRHRVVVARDNERAERGTVYVAPPECHLVIGKDGTLSLSDAPHVGVFRPSATMLFRSMVVFRERALGVVLTGIGEDGATGAAELAAAGATILVQDEPSSTVHGMPAAVLRAGVAARVLPPREIARALASSVTASGGKNP